MLADARARGPDWFALGALDFPDGPHNFKARGPSLFRLAPL